MPATAPTPLHLIELPANTDPRGSITICASGAQLFIAPAGALTIVVDDTPTKERVRLETPSHGLLIPAGVWIDAQGWSEGAVLLMLASEPHAGRTVTLACEASCVLNDAPMGCSIRVVARSTGFLCRSV